MKTLLGCLMCLVFPISQSFAISGGPFGGGGGKVGTTGTYAGVLTPISHVPLCTDAKGNPVACPDQPPSLNQLGLFSVTIPNSGLGTGTALLFNQGDIYTGTIQATADPDSAKLLGIISASFPYVISVPDGVDSNGHPVFKTTTVSAEASGKVNAKVKSQSATGSIRLKGTADVQFELTVTNPFDEILFSVIGFRQQGATL